MVHNQAKPTIDNMLLCRSSGMSGNTIAFKHDATTIKYVLLIKSSSLRQVTYLSTIDVLTCIGRSLL